MDAMGRMSLPPVDQMQTTVDDHPEPLYPLFADPPRTTPYKTVPDELPLPPRKITGTATDDPRQLIDTLGPDGMADKMDAMLDPETHDPVLDEISMILKGSFGLPTPQLPSRPLSPSELDTVLRHTVSIPRSEYTVWIPTESESISATAVGKYRDRIGKPIIRMTIDIHDELVPFFLIVSGGQAGFRWFSLGPERMLKDHAAIGPAAETLDTLVNSDNAAASEFLIDLPERTYSAASMLGRDITAEHPSPTPDGWATTYCELSSDGDFMCPRYEASFIHTDTEAVLTTEPIDTASLDIDAISKHHGVDVELDIDRETDLSDETLTKAQRESIRNDMPTNSWELSFAPDHIAEQVADKYPNPIATAELYGIMTTYNRLRRQDGPTPS